MTAKAPTCAHDSCSCERTGSAGIEKGGRWYCSDACASGQGCGHSPCGCGEHEPAATKAASAPARPSSPTRPAAAHNPGHHVDFNPAQGGPSTRRNP